MRAVTQEFTDALRQFGVAAAGAPLVSQPLESFGVEVPHYVGSRYTPEHVVRRDSVAGTFEEVNAQLVEADDLDGLDAQWQRALLLRQARRVRTNRELAAVSALLIVLLALAKGWLFGGVAP